MILTFSLFIVLILALLIPSQFFSQKRALKEVQSSLDVRLAQLKRDFQFRTKELARRLKSKDLAEDEWNDLSTELATDTKTSIRLTQKAKKSSSNNTSWLFVSIMIVITIAISALSYRYSGSYELSQHESDVLSQLENDPDGLKNLSQNTKNKGSQEALNDHYLALRLSVELYPDDADAWRALALFNSSYGRVDEAKEAMEFATELQPENVDFQIAKAQLLLQSKDTREIFLALDVIHKVLNKQPNNESALLLLGMSYYQFGMYQKAVTTLTQLKALYAEGSEMSTLLQKRIDSATQRLSQKTSSATTQAHPTVADKKQSPVSSASINVEIIIPDAIRANLTGNENVFIFAKAVNGPRFPVAVIKTTLANLSAQVSLTDANAMQPETALSKFDQVTISVRISKTGDVVAKPGDIQGNSEIIKAPFNSNQVKVTVDEVL